MADTCPYCGEKKSALKNHVRLASGGGHGPNGQYPDGFDAGATTAPDGGGTALDDDVDEVRASQQTDSGGGEDGVEDDETFTFTPEELGAKLTEAEEWGYEEGTEDGFQAGYTTAEQELVKACPECGDRLATEVGGAKFTRHDGATLTLEDTDAVCTSCDLVVPEQGQPIRGVDYEDEDEDLGADDSGGGWGAIVLAGALGLVAVVFGAVTSNNNSDDLGSGGGFNNSGPGNVFR